MTDIKDFAKDVYDGLDVADDSNIDEKKVKVIIDYFFERLIEEMKANKIVTIPKFGTFSPSIKIGIRFFPYFKVLALKKQHIAKAIRKPPVRKKKELTDAK